MERQRETTSQRWHEARIAYAIFLKFYPLKSKTLGGNWVIRMETEYTSVFVVVTLMKTME